MPSGRNYQEDSRRARDQRTERRKGRDADVRNANEMRTVLTAKRSGGGMRNDGLIRSQSELNDGLMILNDGMMKVESLSSSWKCNVE